MVSWFTDQSVGVCWHYLPCFVSGEGWYMGGTPPLECLQVDGITKKFLAASTARIVEHPHLAWGGACL